MVTAPILIGSTCKTAEWGGKTVTELFEINSPYSKTSEVWTASALKKGITKFYIKLNDMLSLDFDPNFLYTHEGFLFGKNCKKYKEFPLLAKWIDANDNLSVQVHPDDNYAKANYESYGKSEAWYIASAKPGAKIVYGLKPGTTKAKLKEALANNQVENVLNFVPVNVGEIYYIPAGMVHSLMDGIVVYEIQQSSDITLRLYDWGRTRPIQPEEALEVINYEENDNFIETGLKLRKSNKLKTPYFNFTVKKIDDKIIYSSKKSFKLCSILDGIFLITTKEYYQEVTTEVKRGSSFIIPACENRTVKHKMVGKGTILMTTVR